VEVEMEEEEKTIKKKTEFKSKFKKIDDDDIRKESLMIELAGNLAHIYKKDPNEEVRPEFEELSSILMKLEENSRIIIYKCICALALTAHARKLEASQQRKEIFELKNQLFLSIINNPNYSRIVGVKKGVSKKPLVKEYCQECKEKNAGKHKKDWKYCKKCVLEKGFFDVLSLSHRFNGGAISCFLGKEHFHRLKFKPKYKEISITKIKEELLFKEYEMHTKLWAVLDFKSVIKVALKLLDF
jgi:hypothetical protein